MFQSSFKYYKSKNPPPSFNEVLVIGDDRHPFKSVVINPTNHAGVLPSLAAPEAWKIYELTTRPGLLVIPNPFTRTGQYYWMKTCLLDYPTHPNTTNLTALQKNECPEETNWWHKMNQYTDLVERRKFASTLRWTTLGYQYDWTNKIYTETRKQPFPSDLADLVKYIANVLQFERFSPEAAIVNYYPIGTTLAGHTDHSEHDLMAPLFSLSFGQPAIFLIGGASREDPADAIWLRSGDIIVMTGQSRQCYHAVPRVCADTELPEGVGKCNERWEISDHGSSSSAQSSLSCPSSLIEEYFQHSRVNITVRQVLKEDQPSLQTDHETAP